MVRSKKNETEEEVQKPIHEEKKMINTSNRNDLRTDVFVVDPLKMNNANDFLRYYIGYQIKKSEFEMISIFMRHMPSIYYSGGYPLENKSAAEFVSWYIYNNVANHQYEVVSYFMRHIPIAYYPTDVLVACLEATQRVKNLIPFRGCFWRRVRFALEQRKESLDLIKAFDDNYYSENEYE